MPPTTVAGYRALFGRDPATGEIYQVSSSSAIESINDLSDVTTIAPTGSTGPTGPADGQVLLWDAQLQQWVPGSQANALDDLSDVTTIGGTGPTGPTGPIDGQALLWNEALGQWIPGVASTVASLDDLTDVDTVMMAPVDGNSLIWDDAQQMWIPGIPSGADEVVVGPDDPYAADPTSTVEMWYDTATPPPPGLTAAIDWWDPVANYVEADRVVWPQGDPSVWSALEDTTGWEPGVPQPAPAFYTFPGGAAGPFGLIASATPGAFANGVELKVITNGTLGTVGTLAALGDADDVTLSMSGVGELTAFIKVTAGQDITLTGTPYDPTIDTTIRVLVDFATLTVSLDTSDDGLGWITLDSVTYLAGTDPTVANSNKLHIGHDSTDTSNYDGTLGDIVTIDPSTGTTLTSWVPFWQGTNGTGASPTTGEDYVLLAGTVLTPVDVVDRPSPWYFLADYNGPYLPLTGGTITGDLYVEGTLSANDVVDRTSSIATKSDVMDLDLGAAGRLIDAIHPITFRRNDSPMRRVGLVVEDFEGSGEQDLTDRLIRSIDTKNGEPYDTDERGWSVAGMVAVLVAEVKRLRAEVEDLKNGA